MIDTKTISRFFLKCILYYGLLLALVMMGLGDWYSKRFQTWGNRVAPVFAGFGLVVQFQENQQADQPQYDLEMVLMNKKIMDASIAKARIARKASYVDVPSVNIAFNSTRQGLIPTILLLALILATPIRWRWRKTGAAFWGLLLIHAFILFKMVIWLLKTISAEAQLGFTIAESPFWREVFYYLHLTFLGDMPMRVIVPVLIWVLVCFRREDFHKLYGSRVEPQV